MKYIRVLPEILLDMGEQTEFDNPDPNAIDKEVVKLHINLENWLGDDLLWNFPETIVTERLKEDLENNIYRGFSFENIIVTKDIYFEDNYHLEKPIPKFYWMKVNGVKNKHDFYLKNGELYISERALEYLKVNYTIKNLEIEPVEDEIDDFILGLIEKDKKKSEGLND